MKISRLSALSLSVVFIAQLGCVAQKQYRKGYFVSSGPKCQAPTFLRDNSTDCETAEENTSDPYFLGIVEFDDSGFLYDKDQLNFVLENIDNRSNNSAGHSGAIVVAFAHGWTHNASPDDDSLGFFRKTLEMIARNEESIAKKELRIPRFVSGVYLAWHAHSMISGFEQALTYFPRKAAAHRIGEREASHTLMRLRDLVYGRMANKEKRSRFIVAGHSFGGALVYSAVSPLLSSRLICQKDEPRVKRFSDLVILINPALEASRLLPLLQAEQSHNAACHVNDANPIPQLAIFTSDSDFATKAAFALVQFTSMTFGKLFGISYRNGADGIPNPIRTRGGVSDEGVTLGEDDLDSRPAGHYDPLVTHFLMPRSPFKDMQKEDGTSTPQKCLGSSAALCKSRNAEVVNFGDLSLVEANEKYRYFIPGFQKNIAPLKKDRMPVFNIKIHKDVWDGHGLDQDKGKRLAPFLIFLKSLIETNQGGETF